MANDFAEAELVWMESDSPDTLAPLSKPIIKPEFFYDLFFKRINVSPTTGIKYLKLSDDKNLFETNIIIIRDCYEHMEPHIQAQLSINGRGRIAVTGSPEIGKSVYGVLLVRSLVLEEGSVVYCEKDKVFLFSWEDGVKAKYGLRDFVKTKDKILYAAYWLNTGAIDVSTLSGDKRVTVIHDPKQGDRTVANLAERIHRIVFILSHGHDLMAHWSVKNLGPHLKLNLPVWTLSEVTKVESEVNQIDVNDVNETEGTDCGLGMEGVAEQAPPAPPATKRRNRRCRRCGHAYGKSSPFALFHHGTKCGSGYVPPHRVCTVPQTHIPPGFPSERF